jgi:hypothetical protein
MLYGGLSAFGAAVGAAALFDPAVRRAADQVAVATPLVGAALLVGLVVVAEQTRRRAAA